MHSARALVAALAIVAANLATLGGCGGGSGESPPAGALIEAARRGDDAEVRRLLARKTSGSAVDAVDAVDEKGASALVAAAYGGHLRVAERLIAAGADVNLQDSSRQSAYLIATSEIGEGTGLAMLRLTLANGADVKALDSYNGTGLIRAAHRGYVEIVAELLKTPIAVDHVNRLGWTALLEAIILGGGSDRHVEVLRRLVAAGADVNLADGAGMTPLAHARSRGYGAMVEILTRAGAR